MSARVNCSQQQSSPLRPANRSVPRTGAPRTPADRRCSSQHGWPLHQGGPCVPAAAAPREVATGTPSFGQGVESAAVGGPGCTFGEWVIGRSRSRSVDPAWAERFAEQATVVSAVLAWWLAGPVERVRSTSVPGLAAKPVVDMLAPVRSLKDAQDAKPILEADGWLFWSDDPGRDYRLWFLRPQPEVRTHHLYLIERDAVHACALLAFRDAMRGDEQLRVDYAMVKRSWPSSTPPAATRTRTRRVTSSVGSFGAAASIHRRELSCRSSG